MKKILPFLVAGALALPLIGLAGTSALAQRGGGDGGAECGHHGRGSRGGHGDRDPAAHIEGRTRMLTAILDLDARQQAEVTRIMTAAATEMQTIHQQPSGEARHTAMQALHDRTKASIAALLNPTQRATFDRVEAVRTAERETRRAGHHGHEGGPQGHGPSQPSR